MADISIVIRAKSMLAQAFSGAMGEVSAFGKSVTSRFKSVFSGVSGMAASLGAALSAGALIGYAKSLARMGDDAEEGAKKLQTTTANFQSLNYAANQSGAKIENVQAGFVKLAGVLDDARAGSESAVAILGRLGLTLRDLDGKDPADQFRMVAAAINDLPDGDEKINLFKDALGKGGVEVSAMVSSLGELEREFNSLGMAMDDAGIKAGGKFTDGLGKIQQQLAALAVNSGFLDYLNSIVEEASAQLVPASITEARQAALEKPLSADQMIAERARLDKEKADRLKREKERARAAAIAAGASQQKLDEAEFKKAAELVAGAQERQTARRKAGQSDDYVDYRIASMTALDVALQGGADVVKMIMESEGKAREKQIEADEKLIDLTKEKIEYTKELSAAKKEEANAIEYERLGVEEDKIKSLLWKNGTDAGGGMKSTKSILDAERNEKRAARDIKRNEDKANRMLSAAIEKENHGRFLSTREKNMLDAYDIGGQRELNAPPVNDSANIQTIADKITAIETKMNDIALLNAKG